MWIASERTPLDFLENVFSILRFRNLGLLSFRRFVVMNIWSGHGTHRVRDALGDTQPMRVFRE